MFARLFTNNVNVQTAYSELSKVITGQITDPSVLTSFNPSTSIIVNSQPSGWTEYTSIAANNQVTAGSVIWWRQRNKSGRWKYAGLYRTSTPNNTHKGLIRHYTGESPVVLATNAGTATNQSEAYGLTTEITIAAGRGYLVIASKLTTNAHFSEVYMWLEYPESGMGAVYQFPNHVIYRHHGTGTSYASDATSDLDFSTGIVEICKSGNGDVQVFNGGMASPSTQHSTMKPSYYTSFSNTLDASNNIVAYPVIPLFVESTKQGFLNCSTITGVWGAGHSITTYGSSITIDGIEYAFLKANACLSYLVPIR